MQVDLLQTMTIHGACALMRKKLPTHTVNRQHTLVRQDKATMDVAQFSYPGEQLFAIASSGYAIGITHQQTSRSVMDNPACNHLLTFNLLKCILFVDP